MSTRRAHYGFWLWLLLVGGFSPIAPVYAQAKPSIQVLFSPDGGATESIVRLLDGAASSIHMAAYSFTSKPIAKALADAQRRGVDVRAVLDESNETDRYSSAGFLADAGVPTRVDHRYAVMHDKFLIIDGSDVETGSFNFTRAAEELNAENVIILHGHPEIASQYQARWQALWDESQPYRRRS